jgi:hypothetical protein
MKKVASVLILSVSALCLSACSILNTDAGPCYGSGCPASAPKGAPSQSAARNNGDARTGGPMATNAGASNGAAQESQAKRGQ